MMKQKVLISGGGVPGLVMAHALASPEIEVTLVEPFPPTAPFHDLKTQPEGRTVAIMDEHISVLDKMGVWHNVAPYAAPFHRMRIVDDSMPDRAPSPPHDFDASDTGKAAFMWNTPLSLLRANLWENLPNNVSVVTECDHDNFDLIVAADGRKSPWRERAGINSRFDDTGQAAIVCAIRMSAAHDNISTEYQRPNGPVTFVPLPDTHECSVVFVDKKEAQELLIDKGKDAIAEALSEYMPDCALISEPHLLPLTFMSVNHLYKGKIVLVAEAAHVLHPMGAQGLNLSLKDVFVLSDLIRKAVGNGTSVSSEMHVLIPYAKARHMEHKFKEMTIKTSLEFLRQGRMTGDVRRGVLNTLDRIPSLKKFLLKQASG